MSSLSVFGSIFGSRFLTMNLETRAYLIDTLARAPLYISILFLGTVFMQYANLHAGCTKDGFDIAPGQSTADAMAAEVECLGKAYGLKPSSILTTLNTGAGLIVAILMPVIGSVVDHTAWRKSCVITGMYVFFLTNLAQVFTNETMWFFMVILQGVISAPAYIIHVTALYAYATEIVTSVETDIVDLQANSRVWEVSAMFAFMVLVTIVSAIVGVEEIGKARVAQGLACALAIYPIYVVRRDLKPRPALHAVPADSSIATEGFRRLQRTFKTLKSENGEVVKYLLALLFFESANSNLINASTTLITQQLKIDDPSFILLYILIVTIPGAAVGPYLKNRVGIKNSLLAVIAFLVIGSLTVIFYVHTPERAGGVWVTGLFYGLGIGMTYPLQRAFFMSIMPAGQETEMIGLYTFTGSVLAWLPSLIFTVLNEKLGDLRLAMFSILVFHSLGFALLLRVDMDKAKEDAAKTEGLRYKETEMVETDAI